MTQAPISELFEHGALPFTGRARETQLILDFWNATILAERLRALVITGEAGSGKSRLLEAILPHITKSGGLVAHVKLYHDATAAIAPLVLEALRSNNLFHHVSRGGSGSPLSMAAQGLRRIARLRPLLLVIEDIQLLEGEALQELNQLLEMLADEPISALFATRPVDQGARGIVERHLVEEITLGGLQPDEIAEMWQKIFSERGAKGDIEKVHALTLGNPLALRTALRELVRHGALYAGGNQRQGGFAPPRNGMIEHALQHRVRLLAEGMVAHLSESELKVAMQLATLGEVFSLEAARILIRDAEILLDTLQRRGILVELATPALPLNRHGSAHPLYTFSHSLIHKYLAEHGTIGMRELVRLVAFDPPIYSARPLLMLAEADPRGEQLDPTMFREAIRCVKDVILSMLMTNEPRPARMLIDGIQRLYLAHRDEFMPEEQLRLELSLYNVRLIAIARAPWSEEMEDLARLFLDRTADLTREPCVYWRINALQHWLMVRGKRGAVEIEYVLREEERLLELAPEVGSRPKYPEFLEYLASCSAAYGLRSYLRPIERRMQRMLDAPDVPDDIKRMAWRKLSPLFLREFSTPEELEERLALARELERMATYDDVFLLTELFLLFEGIGEIEKMAADVRRWRREMVQRGKYLYARHFLATLWRGEALLGAGIAGAEEMIGEVLSIHPSPLPAYVARQFGRTLAVTGIICDELAWAREIIDRFPPCEETLPPEARAILALDGMEQEKLRAIATASPEMPLAILAGMLVGERELDAGNARWCVEQTTSKPLMRQSDILQRSAMLRLVTAIDARFPELELPSATAPMLSGALIEMLEWCGVRRLPPVIAMLLRNHSVILTPRQRTLWSNRLAAIAEERSALLAPNGSRPPVGVTMIGTISVSKQGNEAHRIRGERMRVLLALMVANLLVAKPLEQEEFAAIATGIDDDPEAARLSLTHMVYRLRETIGTQAVITASSAGAEAASAPQGTTPQLNLSIVDVDLLRAWGALQTAHEALLDGFLVKAARSLTEAIDIVGSEIIFPTLYDSFFEALRTDFESRLRGLILSISARLTEEGDSEGASLLLERGFAVMPDDEEVAERLQEALVSIGRNADADRIRARAERSLRA